jgi:hypothetical protein
MVTLWPAVTRFGAVIALLLAFVGAGVVGTASAATGLTVTPIEWNVVGLDSNSPADGPHSFFNGVSVCNTGSTDVPDLVTTWVWDSASSAISLLGAASKPAVRLAAGTCRSLWYAVDVVPSASSFDQTRRFHVVASGSGVSTVSTPVPREIYVEHLVSQNRNSITAVNGATAVVVGQSYTYTVTGNTATNGYGQLVASPFFDPSMFEVLGVTETLQRRRPVVGLLQRRLRLGPGPDVCDVPQLRDPGRQRRRDVHNHRDREGRRHRHHDDAVRGLRLLGLVVPLQLRLRPARHGLDRDRDPAGAHRAAGSCPADDGDRTAAHPDDTRPGRHAAVRRRRNPPPVAPNRPGRQPRFGCRRVAPGADGCRHPLCRTPARASRLLGQTARAASRGVPQRLGRTADG